MILEILADPGQRVMHRDARLRQHLRIADAGQLQQMRRADRAGGEDHLARRIGPLDGSLGRLRENSTPAARFPSNITRCTSALVTICKLGRFVAGLQIGARGAGPAAAAAGLLAPADAVAGAGRQIVDVRRDIRGRVPAPPR